MTTTPTPTRITKAVLVVMYQSLQAAHDETVKRLNAFVQAAAMIDNAVVQRPVLFNEFYDNFVKMVLGQEYRRFTNEYIDRTVEELKVKHTAKTTAAQNKGLDPDKYRTAFYVLKEALLNANFGDIEEHVAFSGSKYATMFTLFMQKPEKYIDIINEHGANMCLDVLEHNMNNDSDVDYVPNPGSLINQPLDVNGPGFVKMPDTFPETQPMAENTEQPFFNVAKAKGVFTVPDLVVPLEERMKGREKILQEMEAEARQVAASGALSKADERVVQLPPMVVLDIESVLDTQGSEVIVSGYPGIGLTNLQTCCELPINTNESEAMKTNPIQQTPQNHEMEIDLSDLSSLKPNTIYIVTDGKIEIRENIMKHDTKEPLDKLAAASDEKTLIDNTRKQATDVAMKEFMTTVQAIDDKNTAKLENKPAVKGTDKHNQAIKDYLETEGMIAERFCQLNDNPFNFFVCSVLESTLTVLQEHRIKYMMNEAGELKGMVHQPSELETLAKTTAKRCDANAEADIKDTKEKIDNYRKKAPENQQDKAALLASELSPEEISLLKQIKTSIKSLMNTHGMPNYSRAAETKLGGAHEFRRGCVPVSQFGSDPKSHLFISIFADKKKGKKADKKKGKKKNK